MCQVHKDHSQSRRFGTKNRSKSSTPSPSCRLLVNYQVTNIYVHYYPSLGIPPLLPAIKHYREQIKAAILALKERSGSSLPALKKFLNASPSQYRFINAALRTGVASGFFVKNKGKYKLSAEAKKPPKKKKKKKKKKAKKKKKKKKKKKAKKKTKKKTKKKKPAKKAKKAKKKSKGKKKKSKKKSKK